MAPTERPLSLARALAPDVPERTRAKGAEYFHTGAVVSIGSVEDGIEAVVEGMQEYHVEITRQADGFFGSCECRYFQDRFEVCKHIWAAVLAADARGLLPPSQPHAWIEPVDTPAERSDPEFARPRHHAAATNPPQPWEQFLNDVSQELDAADAARPISRYAATQLMYTMDPHAPSTGQSVVITILGRHRKKNGEWAKPQPAPVSPREIELLPDEADREILGFLMGVEQGTLYMTYASNLTRATYQIVGPLVHRVLPLVARSGRFYLRTIAGGKEDLSPVTLDDGPAWQFGVDVTFVGDADIKVDGALVRGDERMSAAEPQIVHRAGFLIAHGHLARLDATRGFAWLSRLRRSGPMVFPRDAAPRLVEAFARAGVSPESLPDDLRYDRIEVAPRPRVKVTRPSPSSYLPSGTLQAAAEFDYGGIILPAEGGRPFYDPQRRRLVVRDTASEGTAIQRLRQLGFQLHWGSTEALRQLSVTVDQFPRAVRTLVREGWYVEADGRAFRAPQAFTAHVKSGIDWFELHGSVDFGEGRSASIADLLAALKRGDATIVLDDGTRGMVPEEWLERYLRIASFGETAGDHIRYRPTQAALLDALLENQPAVTVDETFARARAELKRFSGIRPLDPPASFNGKLREYQRDALGWFDFLRRFGFGGCLADDMGLGKTVMVLALLESRRVEQHTNRPRPSLTVVPRSLVFNWKDEAARFAPGMRVLDYTGSSRDAASIDDHDLVLTTYGTLRRDAPQLMQHSFDYVILDEAQAIKNAATVSAKAVRLLRGQHRLALSGTPIENHVGELWSLFDFLNPGLLGGARAFKSTTAMQTRNERQDLALVTQAVKPLILRRTKAQVAPELPARTEQTIHCELDGPQRRIYDELRAHYRATLLRRIARTGMGRSKLQVLEALLRLRQAACHPGLVDQRREGEPSAKFDVLLPHLTEVVEEGHKALVFSQFTSFLALLRPRLEQEDIAYEYLDGQTRDRSARVAHFNADPDCRVFLISLKAGGLGLNLTAAEYVFLLDPWWNPAVEAQAIDRAHRIGQERHVFAYRLIAQDTVEEKVAQLQQSKRELADAILTADPALIRNLNAEDLEWLLS